MARPKNKRKQRLRVPAWLKAACDELGRDPQEALQAAGGRAKGARSPEQQALVEHFVSRAERAFLSGPKVALIELLAFLPTVLLDAPPRQWILSGLTRFFSERAYFALAPVLGERVRGARGRKTLPSRVGWLRSEDVPSWISEVDAPDGMQAHELANVARGQPYVIVEPPFVEYFSTLAERAEAAIAAGSAFSALELLDVFPHYLSHIESFPWLRPVLFEAFVEQERRDLRHLKLRLPRKLASDHALAVKAAVESQLVQFQPDPGQHEGSGWKAGRLVPSGVTLTDAVDRISGTTRVPGRPISQTDRAKRKTTLKEIERARQRLAESFGSEQTKEGQQSRQSNDEPPPAGALPRK